MVTRNRDVTKRMNWFDRQFLRAQDFADEQDYWLYRRREHNRLLHTLGVAEGLEVTGQKTDKSVVVKAGTAIDGEGREMVLLNKQAVPLPQGPTEAEIYIAYDEAPDEASTDPGVTGMTRIKESPAISVRTTKPTPDAIPRGGILLAVIALSNGALTGEPNNDVRKYAGLAVTGDLTVPGDLTVQGNLTVEKKTVVETEEMRGNVVLGDEDSDTITVEGTLVTGHSSGNLQVKPDMEVAGSVRATAFQGDGSALTGISTTDNTKVAKTGDTMTGPLTLPADGLVVGANQLALAHGNVGIGTANPGQKLSISGRESGESGVHGFGAAIGLSNTAPGGRNWYLRAGATGTATPAGGFSIADDDAYRMVIDNRGNIGIGTLQPTHKLHVNDNAGLRQNRLYLSGGDGWSSLTYNAHHNAANNNWVFPDQARPAVTIEMDDSNNVPRFQVWSTTSANRTNWIRRFAIDGNSGRVDIDGPAFAPSFNPTSDGRLKRNITPLRNALENLEKLSGVSFEWNEEYRSLCGAPKGRDIGLIAQDVEKVFPELVRTGGENGYKAIDYDRLTAVLVEAIKELKAEKHALRRRIEALEKVRN